MLLSPLEPLSEFVFDRVRFAPLSQFARCALRIVVCALSRALSGVVSLYFAKRKDAIVWRE
jgi:hypothetical protein